MGLWSVAVISYSFWMVAWTVAPVSREAVGHNGDAHASRANIDTYKNDFGPSNTTAYFGTLLLCRIEPLAMSPAPNCPLSDTLLAHFLLWMRGTGRVAVWGVHTGCGASWGVHS